jgi:hypothetical protein
MFESAGNNTKVTLLMLFPTVELRNKTVKEFRADEGQKQTMDKLETYRKESVKILKKIL